jgi:hypothetical protein
MPFNNAADQYRRARPYTTFLLERIDDGLLDKDAVINACVKYMSEDDVQDMMEVNEFCEPNQLEEDQ